MTEFCLMMDSNNTAPFHKTCCLNDGNCFFEYYPICEIYPQNNVNVAQKLENVKLYSAVINGNLTQIQNSIQANADVNAIDSGYLLNYQGYYGESLLIYGETLTSKNLK
jgi:hypothetical protein